MLMLFALLALLFSPPTDKPDCRQVEAITGGTELEWLDDGSGYGYWDLPDDLKLTDKVDFAVGGIWQYEAESEPGWRYIWWWGDYEPGTDSQGDHLGNHNFCAVKVYVDHT